MKLTTIVCLACCVLPCVFNIVLGSTYSIPYVTINDCRQLASDVINQYYDISHLQCVDCAANTTEQVTTSDGKFMYMKSAMCRLTLHLA